MKIYNFGDEGGLVGELVSAYNLSQPSFEVSLSRLVVGFLFFDFVQQLGQGFFYDVNNKVLSSELIKIFSADY